MRTSSVLFIAAAVLLIVAGQYFMGFGDSARADTPPTKHQLLKDCMAKQQAADSGKPRQDLKDACKDVAKTQKENADAQKKTPPQKT
jgi:hypothetical protein